MTGYAWCPICGQEFQWDGALPCPHLGYQKARHLRTQHGQDTPPAELARMVRQMESVDGELVEAESQPGNAKEPAQRNP